MLSEPRHSLVLSGGLGLLWLSASLSYAYRVEPSVWLYVTPELRAASEGAGRTTTGATIQLGRTTSLLVEAGYAYRRELAEDVEGRDRYAYFAWHSGLGVLVASE